MEAFLYYISYPLLWVISRLPFTVVYWISDFVYFIVYYIINYRKDVIRGNLKTAFPELSEQQIKNLHKQNMKHFCDMFIEMIKSMGMSEKEMLKRFTCENVDLVNNYAGSGKPIICMYGHQASYEWTMALTQQMDFSVFGVYKPLKNKKFDGLIRRIRQKFNAELIPMRQASSTMRSQSKKGGAMFALVADQAPKRGRSSNFTKFFDRPTAVFRGGERFGKEYNGVVVFLRVTKVKRGYYTSKYELITDQGAATEDWFITDRFFNLLENQIKKQPAYYLWSHKRWRTIPAEKYATADFSPTIKSA